MDDLGAGGLKYVARVYADHGSTMGQTERRRLIRFSSIRPRTMRPAWRNQIIRVEALDHNIWRRIMLPADMDTKERVDAALEQHLASYQHYGKDPRWASARSPSPRDPPNGGQVRMSDPNISCVYELTVPGAVRS